MGLREEMIKHIQKITGDPNADLWTLQFNEDDTNLAKDKIHPPYFQGIPIRTNQDIEREAKIIEKYFRKYSKN